MRSAVEPNYRRCISCRIAAPKAQFLRVVREPTGAIAIDCGAGRSAYICPNADCIGLAQKKKRLERALKSAVPSELYLDLWRYMTESSQSQDAR
ncbi:YlxR family protein [Altericista sp. CCNU0014]|uniref:YlxR family protein n=1 Tax=Altericista sp. CCNU0014 TaxID=3082949 RepID=UPI00385125F6